MVVYKLSEKLKRLQFMQLQMLAGKGTLQYGCPSREIIR